MKSLVLLSGGLDSAANLAIALDQGHTVTSVTCDYGQRAAFREVEAARQLCRYYEIHHEVVQIPWLGELGKSALTSRSQSVPTLATGLLDDLAASSATAKQVWVPNRNGVLIHVAAALAEARGIDQVLVGFNREEAATFPDNSAAYLLAVNEALRFSTATGVRIESFTVELDKSQMVERLRKLKHGFPFDRVWSCYHGGETACGECESCQRFQRAMGSTKL